MTHDDNKIDEVRCSVNDIASGSNPSNHINFNYREKMKNHNKVSNTNYIIRGK